MPRKYRRYFLKAKEVKSMLGEASEKLRVDFNQIFKSKVDMELVDTDFAEIFLINGMPLLVRINEKILPTLAFNEIFALTPKVVVDMGAVPHVCNGANVMAPGIVRFEGEFRKGDFVSVADEKHGKTIAIGEAAYDVDAAKKVVEGVVIKNVHFVGDKLWNFIKKLAAKT
jgi:PUA-domain protein